MRVNLYNSHFLLFSISSILHLPNQTHMRENKIFYIILLLYHFLIFYLSTFLSLQLNGPLMKLIFSLVMLFGVWKNREKTFTLSLQWRILWFEICKCQFETVPFVFVVYDLFKWCTLNLYFYALPLSKLNVYVSVYHS